MRDDEYYFALDRLNEEFGLSSGQVDSPLIRRIDAVEATIAKYGGKPFVLGKNDCARITAYHLRMLGTRVSLLAAGSYSTEMGARRVLSRMGFTRLEEAVDALGLPRIAPSEAFMGDLLGMEGEGGLGLAVCVGNGRAFAAFDGKCQVIDVLKIETAWRAA